MGNYFSNKEIVYASYNGDLKKVLHLIKEGININIKDSNGDTALIKASRRGYLEIVKELIKADANSDIQNTGGDNALILASINNYLEIVKELIKVGANTDLKNKYNCCALCCSLINNNYDISNLLLRDIKNFNKRCLKFKKRGIIFFYLFPFIKKSKKCLINKIPDDLIRLLLKF